MTEKHKSPAGKKRALKSAERRRPATASEVAKPTEIRPLRKGAKSHYLVEKHELWDGSINLIRTNRSGRIWSMSCYIPAAKRYFRKSLKTRNLEEASRAALEQYFQLRQRLDRGENIFSRSVRDLATAFLENQRKRIRADGRHSDGITNARFIVVRAVVGKHFLNFVGEKTRLENIQPSTFLGYYDFRRKGKQDIRKSTLKNERSLLTAMCRFGVEKGFLARGFVPQFPKISVNTQKYQSKEEARDALTLEQFELVARQLNKMADNASDADAYDRKLFRDFVRIASVTGLRFGEQRKLKWSMVDLSDDDSVFLQVPKDTKTGARPVAGPGANFFKRIRE